MNTPPETKDDASEPPPAHACSSYPLETIWENWHNDTMMLAWFIIITTIIAFLIIFCQSITSHEVWYLVAQLIFTADAIVVFLLINIYYKNVKVLYGSMIYYWIIAAVGVVNGAFTVYVLIRCSYSDASTVSFCDQSLFFEGAVMLAAIISAVLLFIIAFKATAMYRVVTKPAVAGLTAHSSHSHHAHATTTSNESEDVEKAPVHSSGVRHRTVATDEGGGWW